MSYMRFSDFWFRAAVCILIGIPTMSVGQELPIVAVSKFDSTFDNDGYFRTETNPDNYEAMLETQLVKVGRFEVYERSRLDEILGEQGLQEALAGGSALSIDGIDYLIYGSVTKFTSERQEINTGQFNSSSTVFTFGVDIKIVDVDSGEIVRAETIEASQTSSQGLRTGNFANGDRNNDAVVETQRIVAKRSAALLAESIFPIRVVDVDEGDVYLNYGDSILTVGDQLEIIEEGADIVDIDSGLVLGSRESLLGKVEVTTTNTGFSIAKVINVSTDIAVGARARFNLQSPRTEDAQNRQKRGRRI